MVRVSILQIGEEASDWSHSHTFSNKVDWHFIASMDVEAWIDELEASEERVLPFDAVVITSLVGIQDIQRLYPITESYRVLVAEHLQPFSQSQLKFFVMKQGRILAVEDIDGIVKQLEKSFFHGQYGQRYHINNFELSNVSYDNLRYMGHSYMTLTLPQTEEFMPLGSWTMTIPYVADEPLEFWLEWLSDCVDLRLIVELVQEGSYSNVLDRQIYEDMSHPFIFDSEVSNGYLNISLEYKGQGHLQLGIFHQRFSRLNYGFYLAGGKRIVDEYKQEMAYYFNPRNLKPPLMIYFSGYRRAEGFEGLGMMSKLGHPYLLFTDPRLEGGAFYMGSDSLEQQITQVIQDCLDWLGFTSKQLILSGLSMGTAGALYYGALFNPHSIVIGKPILNFDYLVDNYRINRPDDFPTGLDLSNYLNTELFAMKPSDLSHKLYKRLEEAHLDDMTLAVIHMLNEDYDLTAYTKILEVMKDKNVRVIGKGLVGRHNDQRRPVSQWLVNQLNRLIREDFQEKGREDEVN